MADNANPYPPVFQDVERLLGVLRTHELPTSQAAADELNALDVARAKARRGQTISGRVSRVAITLGITFVVLRILLSDATSLTALAWAIGAVLATTAVTVSIHQAYAVRHKRAQDAVVAFQHRNRPLNAAQLAEVSRLCRQDPVLQDAVCRWVSSGRRLRQPELELLEETAEALRSRAALQPFISAATRAAPSRDLRQSAT